MINPGNLSNLVAGVNFVSEQTRFKIRSQSVAGWWRGQLAGVLFIGKKDDQSDQDDQEHDQGKYILVLSVTLKS